MRKLIFELIDNLFLVFCVLTFLGFNSQFMPQLSLVYCWLAILSFSTCLVIHIATFFGKNLVHEFARFVLGAALVALAVFVQMVFLGGKKLDSGKSVMTWDDFPALKLGWVESALNYLGYYAVVIFVTHIILLLIFYKLEGGEPQKREDKYVLENEGQLIREITEEQYYRYQTHITRLLSGFLLVFLFLPVVYFWDLK